MDQISFAIVGLYAGLCALILLWLSYKTIALRGKYKTSIGDGGNDHLYRIMRGHSNAVENMIIVLIMMIIMAALGTPYYILHGFGIALTISRAMHASHFIKEDAPRWTRFYSMVTNLFLILAGALGIIAYSLVILFG